MPQSANPETGNVALTPSPITKSTLNARHLSIMPVSGDRMMPTLRGGWDHVVVTPCARFDCDGLYVVEDEIGAPVVWRCQSTPQGIRLRGDNPAYLDSDVVPREWFDAHVLGFVVADLKVRDLGLLQAARAQ